MHLSGEKRRRGGKSRVVRSGDALRNGTGKEFDRLLRENPEAVNAKGPGGWTPLMYAALYGDADTSACC